MKILGQEGLNFIATKYKELRDSLNNKLDKNGLADELTINLMNGNDNILLYAVLNEIIKNENTLSDDIDLFKKNKVDKVAGKDLSTNDYTDEAKAKVDAIPANPKYTDTVQDLSGYAKKDDVNGKANKTEIKTKLSEMTDDATHRLVTDTEKEMLYNKVGLEDITITFDFVPPDQMKPGDMLDPPVPDDIYSPDNPDRTKYIPKVVSTDVLYDMIKKYELYNLSGVKKQVILTQAEYDALSLLQKRDASKIYFIKA